MIFLKMKNCWMLKMKKIKDPYYKDSINFYSKIDSIYADESIKHCKVCNNCWQFKRKFGEDRIIYYQDFPTFGKEKMDCPVCTGFEFIPVKTDPELIIIKIKEFESEKRKKTTTT